MSAQSFHIFISSPGDVGREREVAYRVIERVEAWFGGRVKLEGYFWEHEPMRTTRGDFQGQIPESSSFDLVVCILWSRLGSRLHPGKHQRPDGSAYASGTEYEFESAIEAFQRNGLPDLLVYRRIETPLFPPEPREEMEVRLSQWEALKAFCERWFRDEREKTFTAAFNAYKDSGDFERTFEEHLKRFVEERLTKSGVAPGPTPRQERWWQGSPYRGLQVFEFEHEPIFFGRTKARDEVLGALRARWVEEKCPFVMIFGASGGGKSSLLRAGVLPWLVRPGLIEGVGMWRMALLRPSDHAGDLVDGLAHSLAAPKALPELLADGTTVEELVRMLREEPKAITGLIKGALSQAAAEEQRMENLEKQPAARLALGLDQLEEVFTLQERFGQESRQLFFRAIAALARSGLVWVVATLRSDFYNRCEEVPELVELKRKSGQYHLLPPAEVELSQMIRYPAEAAGLVFQEDPVRGKLEEVIAREAQGQSGALPLLQYALDLLYHAGGADGLLTHEEYERVGRVTGAVAKKAEQTFAELSTQEMDSLDGVLRGMVTLGEGEEEVAARKVARYEELTRTPGAKGLVDAFLEARLFTGDQDAGGYATVTVAHEALLRVWPRVVAWVRANRAFLRQRARLGQALEQWKTRDGHEDYLLARGLPLAEAESLLKQHEDALSGDEAAFIRASQVRAQRDELRRTKVRRAVMAGFALLAFGASAAAIFGFWQKDRAEEQKKAAEEQAHRAQEALTQSFFRTIGVSKGSIPTQDEREGLWELAQLDRANAEVRRDLLNRWFETPDAFMRGGARGEQGFRAATGLNREYHRVAIRGMAALAQRLAVSLENAQEWDSARLLSLGEPMVALATQMEPATAVKLATRGAQRLAAVLADPQARDPSRLFSLHEPLAALAARMEPAAAAEIAGRLAAALEDAQERDSARLFNLGRALAALAARMEPAAVAEIAARLAAALGTPRIADYDRLRSLGDALAALAARIEPAAAAEIAARLAVALKNAQERHSSSLWSLGYALAALVSQMEPAAAAEIAARLAAALENSQETNPDRLSDLGEPLAALAAQMEPAAAAKAAARLAAALENAQENDPHRLSDFSRALAALAARMEAPAAEDVARGLVTALENAQEMNADRLTNLGDALAALAAQMEPTAAAEIATRGAQRLTAAMENAQRGDPDRLFFDLGRALAALTARMEPLAAAKIATRLAAALEDPKERDSNRLSDLSELLATLAARMEPPAAARIVARLTAALENSQEKDSSRLSSLGRALAALAARMEPAAAGKIATRGAKRLAATLGDPQETDPYRLSSLGKTLGVLCALLPSTQHTHLLALSNMLVQPVSKEAAEGKEQPYDAKLLKAVCAQLSPQDLAEVLKYPFCTGETEQIVLNQLKTMTGRNFEGNVWKFVEQAGSLGVKDVDSPAKRPSATDALKELNAL